MNQDLKEDYLNSEEELENNQNESEIKNNENNKEFIKEEELKKEDEASIEKKELNKEERPKISIQTIILSIVFSLGVSLCIGNVYFTKMIQYVSLHNKTANVSIADNSLQVDFTDDKNLSDMLESVMPTVVSITGTISNDVNIGGYIQSYTSEASGSGVIIGMTEKELLIVTNNHVIQNLNEITVGFTNNESVSNCIVKAKNSEYDLAIISVDLNHLDKETSEYIKIATISKDVPSLGEDTIVIGNSLGYGISVTKGIVSVSNKNLDGKNYLQTDAAINEGNSGGPIFNNKGQIIAIANMKLAGTTIEGMGFGIPTSEVYNLLMELMTFEPLEEEFQGYLGISIIEVTDNYYGIPTGLFVADVVEGCAAKKYGIKPNDIITKLNGNLVSNASDLSETIKNTLAGTPVEITIQRLVDGEYKTFNLTIILGNRPIN